VNGSPPKVLAIASSGGHWVQLRRMRSAWTGCATVWVATHPGHRAEVEADDGQARFYSVVDANRWQKARLLRQLGQIARIIARERPDIVITTGAAPGYFAVRLGRLLGASTAWIDSIANAEELSLSGRKAGRYADLWLTQWPHLAREGGPEHKGAVL
jgi:UDP-N-acetylglucosamine:LPS N-acetylglucosamine transferase